MRLMKKLGLILASVAIAAVAVGAFTFLAAGSPRRRRRLPAFDLSGLQTEEVDGIVRLQDVVAWLKGLNLQAGTDLPFVMAGERVGELADHAPDLAGTVLVGVYDETTEAVKGCRAFRAEAFDKKLRDVLRCATPSNPIVVLS